MEVRVCWTCSSGWGKGTCWYFFCFCHFCYLHFSIFLLNFSFSLFLSSTTSSVHFSGGWHKMTYMDWHVVKQQLKQAKHQESLNKLHCYWHIIVNHIVKPVVTLFLMNQDMLCLCKQYRSRSVGFWRSQLIWICTVFIQYVSLYQQSGLSNLIG